MCVRVTAATCPPVLKSFRSCFVDAGVADDDHDSDLGGGMMHLLRVVASAPLPSLGLVLWVRLVP
jgi:hypothetical protein